MSLLGIMEYPTNLTSTGAPYEFADMRLMDERDLNGDEKREFEHMMSLPIKDLKKLAESRGLNPNVFLEKSEIAKTIIRGENV